MLSLILWELLSVTALLYSLLLIYLEFAPLEIMALLFIWTVAVCLFYYYSRNWSKVFRASALLLLLPLFSYNNGMALLFISITAPLLVLYLEKSLQQGTGQDYIDNFKKVIAIYPAAFFIRWALPDLPEAIARTTPFIFIYFLASIILIRSIRHVDAGMDRRRLRSTNACYLAFMATVFLLTSIARVRNLLGLTAKGAVSLLFLPVQVLLNLLGWLMETLGLWVTINPPQIHELPVLPGGTGGLGETSPVPDTVPEAIIPLNVEMLKQVLLGLLIVGAVFMLYKLVIRAGQQGYRGLDYVEEREYLQRSKQKRGWNRIFGLRDRLPQQPAEQVRYYYRRFLEKLAGQKLKLDESQTSLEIQDMAEGMFAQGPKEIRAIYIDSRYGEKVADEADVRKMEQVYKDLEQ